MSYLDRVNIRANNQFAAVHSHEWGPCQIPSKLVFKYFIIFVDDYSRITWMYLMNNHFEVFSIFQNFCFEVKNQFNISIKVINNY